MRFHVAMHRPVDFERVVRESDAGLQPRHGMWMLSQRFGGTIHQPGQDGPASTGGDRFRARLAGQPEHWALARALNTKLKDGDVVYCAGEDVGFPVAAVCGGRRRGPKVAMFINNVDRPRAKAAMKLFRLDRKIDLFVTNIRDQVAFLREFLDLPEERVYLISDQTDRKFFTPGPPCAHKKRPVIASVGLEQRDYRTLAQATHDLDADVRISGFSTDASVQSRAFPDVLPANMSQRFYSWPELVQLYRDADVVVVSVFECRYSAGITTVMESLSCGRPLVATRSQGLADYLDPGAMTVIPPGDPAAMREAIVALLNDPAAATAQAQRGYELARVRHDSDRFVAELAERLGNL